MNDRDELLFFQLAAADKPQPTLAYPSCHCSVGTRFRSLPIERWWDDCEIETSNLKIGICAVLAVRLPRDGEAATGGDRTVNN